MGELQKEIYKVIGLNPGLQAKEIAKKLSVDKKEVNSLLYGKLKQKVKQDKSYKWYLKSEKGVDDRNEKKVLDTPVTKLSRYYLDCLSHDDLGGVSKWTSSKFDNYDFVELESFPNKDALENDPFETDDGKKLLTKVRRDKNRQALYLGYPIRIRKTRTGCLAEPIFLIPFDGTDDKFAHPTLGESLPQFNFEALKKLSNDVDSNVMHEAITLADSLGLDGAIENYPEMDELMLKLKQIKEEWDWVDDPNPDELNNKTPITKITSQGIYNKAIITCVERSPYTKGLETELNLLQSINPEKYAETTLGSWVNRKVSNTTDKSQDEILEVLPLNEEQSEAVKKSLNNQLTVITGPPGTGKSQVVASILINCAVNEKSVLFVSKNNKAVSVVQTRVNAIGSRPILLRLGANEHQNQLSDYLVSLLASSATKDDEERFQNSKSTLSALQTQRKELENKFKIIINLRNRIDSLEQSIEQTRTELGESMFKKLRNVKNADLMSVYQNLKQALDFADKSKQGLIKQLFWGFIKKSRNEKLSTQILSSKKFLDYYGLGFTTFSEIDKTISDGPRVLDSILKKVKESKSIKNYFSELESLNHAESIESLSKKNQILSEKVEETSEHYWENWLKLQPNRLTEEDRKIVGDYTSLLQMIISANQDGSQIGKEVFRNFYKLFPKVAKIFSCWAVTSLSAKGRVPFEPGFFDLLVIDEASQCDIASVLPLLYRAKRAVVIGDPMQLRHISTLKKERDQQLLSKHDLIENFPGWSYSHRSVFDLASSICKSTDIITLKDHHRSHSQIMGFSNKEFYENTLRVATNYDKLKRPRLDEPAVRWIDVKGKAVKPRSGGALNEDEAYAVVLEIERLLKEGYLGSIGVVSPFRSQANRINELVLSNASISTRIADIDFLADTVHKFQGDERDVMFFSPVVSSGIKDTALSFLNSNPNLFNVAITRARASLVVVGDKAMASQCGVGYLSRFASYSDNMNIESESTFEGYKNPGEDYPIVADPSKVSDWEIYFYKVLFLKGIKTIPQYPVEKYILDFAIIIGDKKLNIEVDGERYHKNWDGELCRRDQIRNQRMMELGWDVMRFWVYQIRDDLEFCVNKINTWIKKNEGEVQSSIKTEVNNATHKEVLRPTIKNSDNQKKIDDALSNGLIF